MEVSKLSGGSFDVTVAALVNAYGFGPAKKMKLDSAVVDSLKAFTGYSKISLHNNTLVKQNSNTQLDFNAIAQGYTVDVLCDFFKSQRIDNCLVELGGELKASGTKYDSLWKVGIDQPLETQEEERQLKAVVTLQDKALCTSGNYRKYYVENGKKFAHIIDPKTGWPAKQSILSSTVVATHASTADAFATAFMVMGLDAAKQFLRAHPQLNLDVYFVYDENGTWKTFTSKGLEGMVKQLN